MKYKLGSQLWPDYNTADIDSPEPDKFEWNICAMSDTGFLIAGVPIGIRTRFDPIVQKARELVDILNKETEKKENQADGSKY